MSKFNIPTPKSQVYGVGRIPPSVAEFREEEEQNLKIDFRYYNDEVCEINLLHKKAKNALIKLKTIGQSTRSNLNSNGIQLKSVYNTGAYKKLFNKGLPDEFFESMKEHKFSGDCRIFCTFEGEKCNVIAITFNHPETKKHRK